MSELTAGTLLAEQYLIEEAIGAGRTGTVYRARDTTLQRDVAVRLGHQAGVFAMAKLSHPNVVTVFELGERDGRAFVVMEYVRGETARDWLARPHRWREIVGMFVAAGDGLAAAHQAGLLDRDFKPEHILIGGDGRPRIAALCLGTTEEQLVEQRAFSTALTEALAQRKLPARVRRILDEPHADLATLLVALRRVVRPRRARWIAIAAGAATAAVGALWLVHAHHRQVLLDDCTRAASAADWSLASRVRVEQALFRTGLATAVATWSNAATTVDGVIARWQTQTRDACVAFEIAHTEPAALHDRRDICLERARIEIAAIVDRLGETDRAHLAQTGRLVGSLPDLGLCERVETLAPVDPARRDKLEHYFTKLAQVESLNQAGRYDEAAKQSGELVRLAGGLDSKRDEAQAEYLAGQIARELGHFPETRRLFEHALTTAEAAADDALVAAIATGLVDLIGNNQANYQEAQQYVGYARAAAERVGTGAARAKISQIVGRVELAAGHLDEAERQLESALTSSEAAHDTDLIASISTDFSRLASTRGRPAQAEPYDRRALAIYTTELGPEHPVTLTAAGNLAGTLSELGRYDEARTIYEQVLVVTERISDPDSQDLAYALNNVGTTAAQAGDFARARTMLERSLVIFEHALGPSHPTVAAVVKNLGDIASYEGHYDDAAAFYTRALDLQRRALGDHHPEVVGSLLALSDVAFARNAPAEANAYCDQARAALAKSDDGGNATQVIAIDICRGDAELAAGHVASALEILELANKQIAKLPDLDPSAVAGTRFSLARALATTAPTRALALARSARELYAHEGAFATHQLAEVDAWLRGRAR
ncbi:MAG: tetratricopeptide repeat-containing protein kinase family protein [Kofleriaceae bacterium]